MSFRGDRGRGGGRGSRGDPTGGGEGGGYHGGGRGGPPGGERGGRSSYGGDRGGSRAGAQGGHRAGGRAAYPGGRGRGRGGGGIFNPPGAPSEIDSRLRDNSESALITAFQNLRFDTGDIPMRPGFGIKGTAIKLRSNFFPVKVPKSRVFHYDVTISPAAGTASGRVRRRIWDLAEKLPEWADRGLAGHVAHDHGFKCVAARKLEENLELNVDFYDEDQEAPPASGGRTYTLTFRFVTELSMEEIVSYLNGDPQYRKHDLSPVLSAFNLILSSHAGRSSGGGGIEVGRNKFFFPNVTQQNTDLMGGLEAWKGFYTSVRPSWKQLHVNVNVCTTAFYKTGNLAVRMKEFYDSTFGARYDAFVRGLRVRTTHLNHRKTIKKIAKQTARQYRFNADGYGTVSVEEYFEKKYKIVLGYPDLPLIDVGGQNTNFLPAEVCEILPNQAFKGKLSDVQTEKMISIAAKPANMNAEFITGPGLNLLGFKTKQDPLSAFGVEVGPHMAVVPGRILSKPTLQYFNSPQVADDRASWNLRNVKFHRGGRLERWAVLLIKDGNSRDEFASVDDPALNQIITGFSNMCATSGIIVDNQPPLKLVAQLPPKSPQDLTRSEAIKVINATVLSLQQRKLPKPKLILALLSNGDKHIYAGLKALFDTHYGISTVCVHQAKIRRDRGQPQFFANVALKVNMKLGGVNHVLDQRNMVWLNQQPTMVVGMDVTHPGPGSIKYTPSIAAVVASSDGLFGQFPASLSIQKSRKEMIERLDELMIERFEEYKLMNQGRLPQRIVIYRDGVSEGQFDMVLAAEWPLIVQSFKKYSNAKQSYRPKVTIVICGKRHHTRFFPTDAQFADDNGNPKAGTVVDRGVTSVYDFDFFLQAHGGLQGTTRPCHYYVVKDENGFNADTMQTLTHEVSYLFARATKAVSLCSPAYYADIACERGRCYLHRMLQGFAGAAGSGTTVSGASQAEEEERKVLEEARLLWGSGVHRDLRRTMFYL